jgi:putative oxidoreductase
LLGFIKARLFDSAVSSGAIWHFKKKERVAMIVLVGRILLGALFVMAGYAKIAVIGIDNFAQGIAAGPFPAILAWPVAIFEIVAGLAIIVGFFTRYTALALAVFCILTGIFYHQGAEEMSNMLKNLALAGGFLILYSHGAGLLSVDARRGGAD